MEVCLRVEVIIRLGAYIDQRVCLDCRAQVQKEREIIVVRSFDESSFNVNLLSCIEHRLFSMIRSHHGLDEGSTYQQLVLCGEIRGDLSKLLSVVNPGGRAENASMDCISRCEVMCCLK